MSDHRFIPKRVFQAIALFLLAVCVGLTIYWTATDSGLFHLFGKYVGKSGGLSLVLTIGLTFLTLFAIWTVVAFTIRRFSQMPTLTEEIGQPVHDLPSFLAAMKRIYRQELAKNDMLNRTPPSNYTPEMKRRARGIGIVYVVAGLALILAVGVSLIFSLSQGKIYVLQGTLIALALMFLLAGIFQIISGRSALQKVPSNKMTKGESPMPNNPTQSKYRAGQVWRYKTRPAEPQSLLTVVKVETDPKQGTIVHIHVQGLKMKSRYAPTGIVDTISHLPLSEGAMDESVVSLVQENAPLPNYQEGYAEWRQNYEQGHASIFTMPVAKAVDFIEQISL
ncbi:MAG TPA: hypothetical protein VNK49_01985 [Anaerolineales bacterium]|nr:hypothetical protein [Anaerolineales bacterium]